MADHGTAGGPPPPPGPMSPFQMLTQPISGSPYSVNYGANSSTGGGKKNAPPPPNYQSTANTQHQQSVNDTNSQTGANRPDQSTPFASSGWTKGPDGQWHQSVGFGGPMAGAARTLQNQFAQGLNSPLQTGDQARNQAISAMYGQATSRLNPEWSQRAEQLNSQLANQGLDPNSQAYRTAQQQFGQQRNDAYNSALNSAIGNGNQAQALTFAQNLEARREPLQELGGLQGFLNMPGFNAAGRADPLQALAAAIASGNYNLNAWQGQNQAQGDAMGGLGSFLGSLAGLGGL